MFSLAVCCVCLIKLSILESPLVQLLKFSTKRATSQIAHHKDVVLAFPQFEQDPRMFDESDKIDIVINVSKRKDKMGNLIFRCDVCDLRTFFSQSNLYSNIYHRDTKRRTNHPFFFNGRKRLNFLMN